MKMCGHSYMRCCDSESWGGGGGVHFNGYICVCIYMCIYTVCVYVFIYIVLGRKKVIHKRYYLFNYFSKYVLTFTTS